MPDTTNAAVGEYRRARETAELLREHFAAAGIPHEENRRIEVRRDLRHGAYVHIPDLSVASAGRLLAALTDAATSTEATG